MKLFSRKTKRLLPCADYDVVVSDMIISAERFRQMRQQREPLYKSIEREGITLWQSKGPEAQAIGLKEQSPAG